MSLAVHFGADAAAWSGAPGLSLQATLASSTAGVPDVSVMPHHPITCRAELRFHGDGRLSCEHATAPPDDLRTQLCIDHSLAILLLELAREL